VSIAAGSLLMVLSATAVAAGANGLCATHAMLNISRIHTQSGHAGARPGLADVQAHSAKACLREPFNAGLIAPP
jgi:hypothetical protein